MCTAFSCLHNSSLDLHNKLLIKITNTVYCFTLSHIIPSVTRYWTTLAINLQCSRPAGLLLFTSILQSIRLVKGKLKTCRQNISTFLKPFWHFQQFMKWLKRFYCFTRFIQKWYFQAKKTCLTFQKNVISLFNL